MAELCDAFVVASPQVSGVPEEQLLVFLYPGLPTTAELFILPDENSHGEHKKDSEEALETVNKEVCQTLCVCVCAVVPSVSTETFSQLFFVTLCSRQA